MANRIEGLVMNADWSGVLVGATVVAQSLNGYQEGSATTDSNGWFVISNLTNRKWSAKLATGTKGNIVLVPENPSVIDHSFLDGVESGQHHARSHIDDHHIAGDQALSLDLIAGIISATGHGDQTGEASAIHVATDLNATADRIFYSDSSGNVQEISLVGAGSSTAGFSYLRSSSATGAPELQEIMRAITITVEDPTSSEDIGIFFFHQAITIREVEAVVVGSSTPSVTINPKHDGDRSAAGTALLDSATAVTNETTGATLTAFTDNTLGTDSFLWLETTAQSGTVDELTLTFRFTID